LIGPLFRLENAVEKVKHASQMKTMKGTIAESGFLKGQHHFTRSSTWTTQYQNTRREGLVVFVVTPAPMTAIGNSV